MEKIWLASYPPEVPAEIDWSAYRSVSELIEASFGQFQERPAFACNGTLMTYGELDVMSRSLAAWLQSRGLERGARVAIMMPNVLPYPISICAVLRAGYVVVNVNPLYTPRELEHQLKDSGAEAIVILDSCAATLDAIIAHTQVKHVLIATQDGASIAVIPSAHTAFDDAIAEGGRSTFAPVCPSPDDIAFLQYTGGGDRRVQRGDTVASEHRRECIADGRLAQARSKLASRREAVHHGGSPSDLSHLCAQRLLPADDAYGRDVRTGSESA